LIKDPVPGRTTPKMIETPVPGNPPQSKKINPIGGAIVICGIIKIIELGITIGTGGAAAPILAL
jgi:hypothetical protein